MTSRDDGGAVVIALWGQINVELARDLAGEVARALDTRMHVVVDLTEVSFIDCACLRVLVAARRQADRRRWAFAVVAPAPTVARALHLVLLDAEFPTFRTLRGCLAWLRTCPAGPPAEAASE